MKKCKYPIKRWNVCQCKNSCQLASQKIYRDGVFVRWFRHHLAMFSLRKLIPMHLNRMITQLLFELIVTW